MDRNSLGAEFGGSGAAVGETLSKGSATIGSAANDAMDAAASTLELLRNDLNGLKDTITTFMAQAGNDAMKSAQDMSSALAHQGANVASGAVERGKTLAGDIEAMTRRHPLGAIVGAAVIGMLIGTLGRRH